MDRPAPKTFALVDVDAAGVVDPDPELDLSAFYVDNDLGPDDANAIGRLNPDEEHRLGGGAGVLFAVRRLS